MELNAGVAGLEAIVIVGKGVTFDAGHLHQPSRDAVMDMSGAAAVIGTMGLEPSRIPIHLVGLVPATESAWRGGASGRRHYPLRRNDLEWTTPTPRAADDALAYARRSNRHSH